MNNKNKRREELLQFSDEAGEDFLWQSWRKNSM